MSTNPSQRLRRQPCARGAERGYVMLTLLLMVAMMALVLTAAIPAIRQEAQRDREEELVHRGIQYYRAIRLYYKRFGRYPATMEALETTNNIRFLRKRYKDPMNCPNGECQDFRILHFGEVKMSMGGGIPGAVNVNALNGANGAAQAAGATGKTLTSVSNDTSQNSAPTDANDASKSGDASGQPGDSQDQSSGGSGNAQTFGGMPMVGVVSFNKRKGIHEYDHKNKYSDWQFVYDPMVDRGAMINVPNATALAMFGNMMNSAQNPNALRTPNDQSGGAPGFSSGAKPTAPTPPPTTPTDSTQQ